MSENTPAKPLKELIESKIRDRFVELTDSKTFETELSFALQHINKNPQLKKATAQSNIQAVLNIAQTGLTLNPVMKMAYLVPRFMNGQVETHLEPSYIGLCKLVTDTGSAKRIYSHVVHEGDTFEVSLRLRQDLIHKPNLDDKRENKAITHVYSVAVLADGEPMIEVMTVEQINDIRERSEAYKAFKAGRMKSCVWESDYSEMARKTVIRRAIKQIPKTEMWDRVGQAVALDETDYSATEGQRQYIETLLMNVNIDHDEQAGIYRELPTMNQERAIELISYLKENQLDPIHSGNSYGQTQIKEKIANEIGDESQ